MPGRFARSNAAQTTSTTSKRTTKAPAPARRRVSRYKGIEAGEARVPLLPAGDYLLEVASHEEKQKHTGAKTWAICTFLVIDSDGLEAAKPGEQGAASFCVDTAPGLKEFKRYAIAMSGHETEDEYDDFDPEGEFMDALFGEQNDMSSQAKAAIGTRVAVSITRGRDVTDDHGQSTGDYYREYRWDVAGDQG